jgi:hypothetical protein
VSEASLAVRRLLADYSASRDMAPEAAERLLTEAVAQLRQALPPAGQEELQAAAGAAAAAASAVPAAA